MLSGLVTSQCLNLRVDPTQAACDFLVLEIIDQYSQNKLYLSIKGLQIVPFQPLCKTVSHSMRSLICDLYDMLVWTLVSRILKI